MKAYRSAWRGTVVALTAVSLVVGGVSIGWIALLGTTAGMAVTGAVVSFAWVEDPTRRWRVMADLALWFAAGAVLVLGLPSLLGPWALFVLVAIGASCPPLVDLVLRALRERRTAEPDVASVSAIADLDAAALERLWVRTTRQVRERRGDVAAVLALVERRQRLLDEIERRDPAAFDAVLVRAGWREAQDR
jgi:hypothetical protein